MKKLLSLYWAFAFLSCSFSLYAQPIPVFRCDFKKMAAYIQAQKMQKEECNKTVTSNVITITVIKCTEEVADNRKKERVIQ